MIQPRVVLLSASLLDFGPTNGSASMGKGDVKGHREAIGRPVNGAQGWRGAVGAH